jgi:poly-beta-1,6-N-acetyl-D-glucosamine synthase
MSVQSGFESQQGCMRQNMSIYSMGSECSAYTLKQGHSLKYVLITPAWNEAEFIEKTIMSVIDQTVLPMKWVIVSDGSTDGTDDIVKKYNAEYAWMELVRMPERAERHFAGKVHAFNAGYAKVKGLKYDIIGNIDADISFGRDHIEFLLDKFVEQEMLGVAGTADMEGSSVKYDYSIVNIEDVSGACQLFRRECFEEIGGYIPIKGGGIDWTAVNTARMKGWKTRTFTDKVFIHHRKRGTGQSTLIEAFFRFGKEDYNLGSHPLWEVFRCLYHMKNKPYLLGGLLLFSGYLWASVLGAERPISAELVAFRRKEQMQRLKAMFRKFFCRKRVLVPPNRVPVDSVDTKS